MDSPIQAFQAGVQNYIRDEIIKEDAAQDELNWITQDARLKLVYGRIPLGTEGSVGMISGLWKSYKVNGTAIYYRKVATKIQYWSGTTWTDVITGLTSNSDYCFQNYSSLAGSFIFFSGPDGLWKINTANPGSPIVLYDASKNDAGYFLIDKGRMIMWNCKQASKTTLRLSYKDPQDSRVYTNVTGEATGSGGGTLGFKGSNPTASCFGVTITITSGGEVFTDNKDGTLKGSAGGTGTINYATGVYTLSHSGVGTASYFWEDSNNKGITDFRYTVAGRVAGEGALVPQNEGGDAILNVEIGQDGNYYSMKSQSAYFLSIASDDTTINNYVYRSDIGVPFWQASQSTNKGIVFINTANPDKPEMTILQRNVVTANIEPLLLFPSFKFSLFDFSDCFIFTTERYVMVACKLKGAVANNRILICDVAQGSVDICGYGARQMIKDGGQLYAGSPISQTVFNLFNGFDDNGYPIQNYWISRGDQYSNLKLRAMKWRFIGEALKKFRRLRFSGLIAVNQTVQVYVSYDDAGFQLVGTISGQGAYVDYNSVVTVGSNMLGEIQVGGGVTANAYPFMCEMKVKCPKFRKRTIKLVATDIGYVEIGKMMDWDIMIFENRIPARFRSKQHVDLSGAPTNEDYFNN